MFQMKMPSTLLVYSLIICLEYNYFFVVVRAESVIHNFHVFLDTIFSCESDKSRSMFFSGDFWIFPTCIH